MTFKIHFFILLTITFCLGVLTDGLSQKKSKNKEDKVVKSEIYTQHEAEYYFTEGEKQYILEDFAKAVNSFRSSIQLMPTNDVAYFKLAQIYNKTEQLDAAKFAIQKALELNNSNPYYYLLGADIYSNANNLDEAAKIYEELLSKIPDQESALFQLAVIYMYLNKYDLALETYQRAENYFGINEQSSVQKQKVYLKLNKVEEAINEGIKLMNANPGNPKYSIMLADVLSSNGQETKAISLIEDLLKTNTTIEGVRLQLADLYRKTKDLDRFEKEINKSFINPSVPINAKINVVMKYMALLPDSRLQKLLPSLCDQIVEVHPEDPNGYLLLGDVYSSLLEKQLVDEEFKNIYKRKAISGYYHYVGFDESKFNVWQNLLNMELQLNQTDSVIMHSQTALAVFPNQTWLYLVAGIAYSQEKDWKEAVYYFNEGIKRASTNIQMLELLYGYLGDSYYNMKDFEKSDSAYNKVLEINPNNELILNNYSYYLSLRGEHLDKAKEMSIKLMRLNSDELAYLDTYGWVQFKLENYKEAKRVFEKIIDSNKASADNYDHYGDVLYMLGDIENAKIQWIKAKELDKNTLNIDKKIEQGKIIQ